MGRTFEKHEAASPKGQRQKLFLDMLHAIVDRIDPDPDTCEEQVFEGKHQHVVREALAALSSTLLCYTLQEGDDVDRMPEIFEEFTTGMRRHFLGEDLPVEVEH
jgi:hypothetical protein